MFSDVLQGGDTSYVQVGPSSAQSGAFKISSGTVVGEFYINKFSNDRFQFHARDSAIDPAAIIRYRFANTTSNLDIQAISSSLGTGDIKMYSEDTNAGCGDGGGFLFNTPIAGGTDGNTVCLSAGQITATTATLTSISIQSGGSSGKSMCWKTATTLGYCSSVIGVDGSCTCN